MKFTMVLGYIPKYHKIVMGVSSEFGATPGISIDFEHFDEFAKNLPECWRMMRSIILSEPSIPKERIKCWEDLLFEGSIALNSGKIIVPVNEINIDSDEVG